MRKYLTEEHKRKIALSRIGKKHSSETRNKIGGKNSGIKHSEVSRKNMSEAHKGLPSSMKGKKHTEETRKKISEKLISRRCPGWNGGLTLEHKRVRASLEYKLWREAVFRRDDFTCVWCFSRGVELNADHIKPFAYFPELRFAIDNGRTLCVDCHKTTETYGNKVKNYVKTKRI